MRKPRLWWGWQPEERWVLEEALESIRTLLTDDYLGTLGLETLRRHIGSLLGQRTLIIRSLDIPKRQRRDRGTAEEIVIGRSVVMQGQGRLAAVLFGELVRLSGGSALDVATLPFALFPGAAPPPNVRALRSAGVRESAGFLTGRYVLLNLVTGQLFSRVTGLGQVRAGPLLAEVPLFDETEPEDWADAPASGDDASASGQEAGSGSCAEADAAGSASPEEEPTPAEEVPEPEEEEPAPAAEVPEPEEAPAPAAAVAPSPSLASLPLAGLLLPPEAQELLDAFANLGSRSPKDLTQLLQRMTALILAHRVMPPAAEQSAEGREGG